MAAHAVEITMTEDMIEAMMIGTITADRTEEEEEEEVFIYCQWLFLHCNSIVEYLYQKQSGLQSQTYVPPEHLQKKMH